MTENDERLPRGPQGEQGRPGGLRELPAATRRSIVFLFVIAAGFGVFNTLWTSHQVNHSAAVQQAEQRQYEQGQRTAAAQAAQAQIKASVPVCMALLQLSEVNGSHGTTSATYGIRLEAALKRVYRTSKCPAVLAIGRKDTP